MTIVEMCVHMDCLGCERKIRKALQKLEGVDDVDIDMVRQKVTVTGWVEQKKVLKAVRKTGRRAVVWPYPYNPEYQTTYSQQYYHQHQPTSAHNHAPYAAEPHYYYSTAAPASSYNYRKHGYDESDVHGYYPRPAYSTIVDERAGALFSDDNPNACSVM